ncbi:class I SAM-dependent methyltransferase [Delftia acidovorans]|uniref:class I SAM-dependent methyltransferase n=1 Tax=Delftia acidovorans TaxID=80866 RepID=UPI001EDF7687|nr:class I SAM-dependent methyltransferase [Delftia acidovorans]MCG3783342.1 class I SAM-dependent methyltransferase [Delftia acidovorans]
MEVSLADGDVRYVPAESHVRDLTSIAHEGRYYWLADNFELKNKHVMDFGCGSGYGAAFIADQGANCLGVDISKTSIEYARKTYLQAKFESHDLTNENLQDIINQRFDLIVSFDVIEHVEKYWTFVSNIKKLLKPGGTAIIGCPNRLATFDFNTEWNEFHCQEFTPSQLKWLLGLYFDEAKIIGQEFSSEEIRRKFEATNKSVAQHAKALLLKTEFGKALARIKNKSFSRTMRSDHAAPKLQRDEIITFKDIDFSSDANLKRPFGLVSICS